MNKDNEDIKKELEELEKLIEKVKKQNEEEKRKQKKEPRNTVIRINLGSGYSNNFWINLIFSFLVNFIVIFVLLKLFYFADVSNDLFIVYIVGIFTVIEEIYRKYLLARQVKIILYTSGLIFAFLNLLIFYVIDLFVFVNDFSFINYLYPLAFIALFQSIRAVLKNLYLRINHHYSLKKIKRNR
ncbi:MAG: hypothetical protein JXL85_01905 [Bacilli bacterium]|nr:hypothetical protein [Bacilli bacterium]